MKKIRLVLSGIVLASLASLVSTQARAEDRMHVYLELPATPLGVAFPYQLGWNHSQFFTVRKGAFELQGKELYARSRKKGAEAVHLGTLGEEDTANSGGAGPGRAYYFGEVARALRLVEVVLHGATLCGPRYASLWNGGGFEGWGRDIEYRYRFEDTRTGAQVELKAVDYDIRYPTLGKCLKMR